MESEEICKEQGSMSGVSVGVCSDGQVVGEDEAAIREQRSHIAIIQMAPPAQAPSTSRGSAGKGGVSKAANVVKSGARSARAQKAENPAPKKRHHCSVQGCTYNTPHTKDLARHMRKHTGEKPFSCDRCRKPFTRYDKLVMHIRIHEGHRPFSCQFCNYAAVDSNSLRKHLRTHSNERPYKCQLCSYSSKNSSQLVVHLRRHTGDAPYLCAFVGCDAAFKTPSDLSRHTRLHTGEKPYKCLYCDYRAAVKCNLNVHMRRHTTPSQKKTKIAQVDEDPIESESLPCQDEDEDFLPTAESQPDSLPFQYACKLCDCKADTIELFGLHMEQFHPDSHLNVRNSDDPSRPKNKKRKKIRYHAEEKNFQCSTCNASFVCEDSLRCHMRQHGTIPNKPANVAPELYTPPSRLLVHEYRSNPAADTERGYVFHEIQRLPVPLVHSVITENPTVIACTNANTSIQRHELQAHHMYLVDYSNAEREPDMNPGELYVNYQAEGPIE